MFLIKKQIYYNTADSFYNQYFMTMFNLNNRIL